MARALPDHEIGAELGRGQFGVVWAARHRQLDRAVAVKQLAPTVAATPEHASRFRREARILASLDHPHVVTVHDYREEGDLRLLIMELLPGGTMKEQRRSGFGTVLASTLAACCGLHHVHTKGMLHRDVKPQNLMFDARGALKVTDFGLARGELAGETAINITRAGDFFGTPAYVAPEQVSGSFSEVVEPVGPAADQYAVAALLYEALAGRLTHDESGGVLTLCHRRMSMPADPLPAVAPDVPAPVAAVVMRGVQRHPEDRYESVEEFGVALGAAAHRSLGPGWLERAGVDLRDAGPVRAAAEGRAEPAGGPAPRDSGDTVLVGPPAAVSPATVPPPPTAPPPPPAGPPPAPPAARRRGKAPFIAAGLAVLLIGAGVAVLLLGGSGKGSADRPTTTAARATVPVAGKALAIKEAWTFATGGQVFASPAVAQGLVVVGSQDGIVYGVDATTGKEKWQAKTGDAVRSSAAIDGSTAYVGSDDGMLYALDLAGGGAQKWAADVGYNIVSSPAVGGGVVVVGADQVYAFDAATGDKRWMVPTGDVIVSSPVIQGDVAVVGSNDGKVRAVSLADGAVRWTFDLGGGAVAASPRVADGKVFVGSVGGQFAAIDLATGNPTWQRSVDGEVRSSAAIADGKIIVGVDAPTGNSLVALDEGIGTKVWSLDTAGRIDSSPLVVGDRVVAGSDDGTVVVAGLADGALLGSYETGGPVLSSPRLSGTLVVVGSYDRKLWALSGITP